MDVDLTDNSVSIGTHLTLDEWAALPEDDEGELVDGILVEEEEAGYAHALTVAWLIDQLYSWLEGRGGFVVGSGAKFGVGPRRGRMPDASAFLPGSRPPPAEGLVTTPPDIAIEVASYSPRDKRRDRVEKAQDYAAFGVKYYWIVDPWSRLIEILELRADGRYVRALAAASGSIDVPGCAGLVLRLDQLWPEIDRLSPPE
jgi:Uma2 family endonuclease